MLKINTRRFITVSVFTYSIVITILALSMFGIYNSSNKELGSNTKVQQVDAATDLPKTFSLSPISTVTPSLRPIMDPPITGWATGLATNKDEIASATSEGAGLSGVMMEPFADGPGGSTIMSTFNFNSWLRAAIAYSKDTVAKITFEARADKRPLAIYNEEYGSTDGWSMGAMQDQVGIANGAYGDYSDTELHQGIFESYGMINLGKSTVNWTKYTVPINGEIDWSKQLQVFFLVDLSTEPQTQPWTMYVRNLRLNLELQK